MIKFLVLYFWWQGKLARTGTYTTKHQVSDPDIQRNQQRLILLTGIWYLTLPCGKQCRNKQRGEEKVLVNGENEN